MRSLFSLMFDLLFKEHMVIETKMFTVIIHVTVHRDAHFFFNALSNSVNY